MENTLEAILLEIPNLNDTSKEKVCIINDISKSAKLLGYKPLSTEQFDCLYGLSIIELEHIQKINYYKIKLMQSIQQMKDSLINNIKNL